MTTYDASPYLSGNFAPVGVESTALDLPVIGSIPDELSGRFLRSGPNPRETPDMEKHHWFFGEGMVHGVRLGGGRAQWYRNRYVGTADMGGPNTSIIGHAGKTLAIVEAGAKPMELTDELDRIGPTDLGGLPSGFTAHPKLDPLTGELHAVCYHWPDQVDKVHYVVVGADGVVSKAIPISAPTMPMIHDMALTQSYGTVFDLPVAVDFEMAMGGSSFPLRWFHDYEARIGRRSTMPCMNFPASPMPCRRCPIATATPLGEKPRRASGSTPRSSAICKPGLRKRATTASSARWANRCLWRVSRQGPRTTAG